MAELKGQTEPPGRLTADEAARLSEHLAGLTAAGLPVAPGLRAVAQEMPRRRSRAVLLAIASAVEAGATIDEAVAAQGDRLPGHLRGFVLAGVKSGRMGEVLGRLVAFTNVGVELRRGLWISLAYPVMAVTLALGLVVLVCGSLVQTFESIFRDFGVPTPLLTQGLIRFSRLFAAGGRPFLEGVLSLLSVVILSRVFLGEPVRRGLLGSLPVFGGVWRNSSLAEFSHLLALLLECELPLPVALALTGDGVRDLTVRRACRAMKLDVEGGMRLSEAVARQRVIPVGLGRVFRWAEENQGLPESLHMTGEMFEARAKAQARLAGTVLTVAAVIGILSGAAAVVIGLLFPMIVLISKLSG